MSTGMGWDMPSSNEMDQIESTIPKRIADLSEGHFKGMVEQVILETDDRGYERNDMLNLAIRILETGNPEHIGELLMYSVYLKSKKGQWIPQSYRFLTSLDETLGKGGPWHPSSLSMVEFSATVEYQGKYWNINNPVFIKKHRDFEV